MVGSKGQRSLLAIGVLALSFVAVALFTPLAVADGHTDPLPEGETIAINDSIAVWERAILTTRADHNDAATTIDNADWRVRNQNNDETSLNKDPIPIFEPDDAVSFDFDKENAEKGGDLVEESDPVEVEVIRAHVDESGEGSVPTSAANAMDLLTLENANKNASFKSVKQTTLDELSMTFEDSPEAPGQYVYFVVIERDSGFKVDPNKLSLEGSATVVGAEQIVVREGKGKVTEPDSVEPGNDASFSVDASDLEGESFTQGIVVYNESKYTNSSIVVDIEEDLDSDFDLETSSTLETDIGEVNGVASLDDDIERFGVKIEEGSIARSGGVASLVNLVSEAADEDFSENVDPGSARLNASVTVIDDTDPQGEIDVGTFENWSTGTYRWVYVATAGDSQELLLDHGTIEVKEEETSGGSGDDEDDDETSGGIGGGGGGGGVGTPITTDTPTATATPGPTDTATPTETESPTPTDTQTSVETETTTTAAGGGGSEPPSGGGLPTPVIIIGLAMVAAILGASLMYLRNP